MIIDKITESNININKLLYAYCTLNGEKNQFYNVFDCLFYKTFLGDNLMLNSAILLANLCKQKKIMYICNTDRMYFYLISLYIIFHGN